MWVISKLERCLSLTVCENYMDKEMEMIFSQILYFFYLRVVQVLQVVPKVRVIPSLSKENWGEGFHSAVCSCTSNTALSRGQTQTNLPATMTLDSCRISCSANVTEAS